MAILMVVCYHIWFGRVSGGVDIFLLISAFLLTGSFTRKLESGRPLRVPEYWIHAFKRLLPPAAVVILATLVGVLLVLPETRWRDSMADAIASVAYVENFRLSALAVDYYAADHSTASPFQHFWSLSIQGQVFLLWPLLFLAAALIVRRTRLQPRPVLAALFGCVLLTSFAWSVWFTANHQTLAYFDTRSRLWEFALGSLLALALPRIERRLDYRRDDDPAANGFGRLRAAASWLGMILILSAGWVLDIQGGFPGYIAAWPLLAACLVIAAGPTGTRWGADRLLSSRPLQWLGDISYALYLVHWPLLALGLVYMGRSHAGPKFGALLVAVSIVLAWALTRLVDSPVRYSTWIRARWWRGLLVIATSTALVLGAVGGIRWGCLGADDRADDLASHPGARSLEPGFSWDDASGAAPLPTDPVGDWTMFSHACSGHWAMPEADRFSDGIGKPGVSNCMLMDPALPASAPTLLIIGSSHAHQFAASVLREADAHGWQVVSVYRNGCPWGRIGDGGECDRWEDSVLEYAKRIGADAALTTSTYSANHAGARESLWHDARGSFQRLLDAGVDVIAFRDNPRWDFDMLECGQTQRPASSCDQPVARSLDAEDPSAQLPTSASTGEATLYRLDMTDLICPDAVCRPVIGNVATYIDDHHISERYARSMSDEVVTRLRTAGFSFDEPA